MCTSPVMPMFLCCLCNQPVFLEPSRIDGHGRPVHENCYLCELIAEPYPEERGA